jgi:hypothetical protein
MLPSTFIDPPKCHVTIDLNTPPIPTDLAALTAAAVAVPSDAKVCWLGAQLEMSSPAYTYSEYFVNFQAFPIPGECSAADHGIALDWFGEQAIINGNGTITRAVFVFDDACSV